MITIQPIWTESTTVKPHETDFLGRWKPHCFFQALQTAATTHATHLGLGYHAMLQQGTAWLLARLQLKVLRCPRVGERVNVQTWPRGLQQKIFFMRDYFMTDEHDQKIAAATSAWVLVNVEQRSLVKPDPAMLAMLPDNRSRLALGERLEKIGVPENMQEQLVVQARYSTIDLMQHVNNTRYIEWASDCFSMDEHRTRTLDSIQINYASEVKPGEQVSVQCTQQDARIQQDTSTHIIAGTNLTTGARAFESVWVWKQGTT